MTAKREWEESERKVARPKAALLKAKEAYNAALEQEASSLTRYISLRRL